AAAWAAICASAAAVLADEPVAQFYKGRQINIVIGSSVGGGYDTYGRLVGRYLGAHIPGQPTIVPMNMPGAGSNRAAYYVYAVAPKDGTVIGAIFAAAIIEPLLGTKPVQHDASKFLYLGSANNDVFTCLVRADAPAKTYQDALSTQVVLAASQEGGSTRDFPTLSNRILGTKFRIVSGYAGTREMTFAIERGEVQGQCGMSWPSLLAQHPDWVESGKIRVLAQEALKGHPDLDKLGVPLTLDFARSEEDREVLKLVYTQELFGRPYVLPPGVPAERVEVLRRAFMETMQDPALRADAAKMRVDVDALPGDEIQKLVATMYATPRPIVERARQALADQ
ncbi:MAG TPA: hypothetical protein VGB82_12040, partial [Alphaproteobacteria bacterium]